MANKLPPRPQSGVPAAGRARGVNKPKTPTRTMGGTKLARSGKNSPVRENPFGKVGRVAGNMQSTILHAYSGQSRDFVMLGSLIIILVGFGLMMVLSASYVRELALGGTWFDTVGKQLLFVTLGFIATTILLRSGYGWVERSYPFLYGLFILIQLSVFVFGVEVNGNKNWIPLFGGFSFQPSEFFKVLLPMMLAGLVMQNLNELDNRRTWMHALVWLAFPVSIIVLQKDLGTVIVILAAYIGMAMLIGLPGSLFQRAMLIGGVLMVGALMLSSTRVPRILAWLHLSSKAQQEIFNYQQDHGIWALAAGGIAGVGLGESKMKWSWIPEVDNDFIFAVIGEELGMLGCLLVIALFILLINTLIRISNNSVNIWARYYVLGVATWLGAQAFINIAVVLGLLPVLGVPLPLISQGGSSMVAVLAALGLVLAIEAENHRVGGAHPTQPLRRPAPPKAARR